MPSLLKLALPALAVAYLLWPADLLLDLVPILGQVDDVVVILLALKLFESWAPRAVVAEHLDRIRGRTGGPPAADDSDVIDGEYRVL